MISNVKFCGMNKWFFVKIAFFYRSQRAHQSPAGWSIEVVWLEYWETPCAEYRTISSDDAAIVCADNVDYVRAMRNRVMPKKLFHSAFWPQIKYLFCIPYARVCVCVWYLWLDCFSVSGLRFWNSLAALQYYSHTTYMFRISDQGFSSSHVSK